MAIKKIDLVCFRGDDKKVKVVGSYNGNVSTFAKGAKESVNGLVSLCEIATNIQIDNRREEIVINYESENLVVKMRVINYKALLNSEEFTDFKKAFNNATMRIGYTFVSDKRNCKRRSNVSNAIVTKIVAGVLVGGIAITGLSSDLKGLFTLTSKDEKLGSSDKTISHLVNDAKGMQEDMEDPIKVIDDEQDEPLFVIASNVSASPAPANREIDNSKKNSPSLDGASVVELPFGECSEEFKAVYTRENYFDTIKRIAPRFGIDAKLELGLCTQERYKHSNVKDETTNCYGLTQIHESWIGHTVSYYEKNMDTQEWESKSLTITKEMLQDLEGNITVSCIILQDALLDTNFHIAAGLTHYNMTWNGFWSVIDAYARSAGKTREEIFADQSDIGFLDYRELKGDKGYVENIMKWIYDNDFTMENPVTGEVINVVYANANELEAHKTM